MLRQVVTLEEGADMAASNEWHRKYYAEHRDTYRANTRRQEQKSRDYTLAAKKKPCADCGVEYPYYVMDFDHVRGEKAFNIGNAHRRRGYRQIVAEVAKCDIVCSNCHRERTHARRVSEM